MLRRVAFFSFLLAVEVAFAEDGRTARYAFLPVEEGTLRLDTRTGSVSLCTTADGAIRCRPFSEDADLRRGADALMAEVAFLKDQIAALEEAGGGPGLLRRSLERVAKLSRQVAEPLAALVRQAKADL